MVENWENKSIGLQWSKFSENVKAKISDFGKTAYRGIYQDGVNITKKYKDMETLKMTKPQPWLKQEIAFYFHS